MHKHRRKIKSIQIREGVEKTKSDIYTSRKELKKFLEI